MLRTARRRLRESRRERRRRACASEKRCTGNFGARTGLRSCNPDTGRWLNRDPIEEVGGANIYCFVNNTPTAHFDSLGLFTKSATNAFWKSSSLTNSYVVSTADYLDCCGSTKTLGRIDVRHAWVDASITNTVPGELPSVWSWLDSMTMISKDQKTAQKKGGMLGAGFVLEFTPDLLGSHCCDSFYWKQEKKGLFGRWQDDGSVAGNFFADSAGGHVDQYVMPQWIVPRGREYRLRLICVTSLKNEVIVHSLNWSYTNTELALFSWMTTLNLP